VAATPRLAAILPGLTSFVQASTAEAYPQAVRIRGTILMIGRPDRKCSSFQDMAAEELISFDELRSKLAALEETRKTARRELEALSRRREKIEELERDKNALLESYVGMVPEGLDALTSEERHRLYKILRLRVVLGPGAPPEVSGAFGDSILVCGSETSSGKPFTSPQTGQTARP
jgi:hypothetical protein